MARKIKEKALDSREARLKLKIEPKPYWRSIGPKVHLGYRRRKERDGTWTVRHYVGYHNDPDKAENPYAFEVIGAADDYSDADGVTILTWWQAVDKAREHRVTRAQDPNERAPLPTVRQAVESHIAERDARETRRKGRPFRSDAHRLERYVTGREQRGERKVIRSAKVADVALRELTEEDLSKWRANLPVTMATTSKQRLVNDLKAALNAAYAANRSRLNPSLPVVIKHGLKAPNGYDEEAAPLARDNQILTDTQVSRLIQAAWEVDNEQGWGGDLYRMTVALAATGARFSQVARMQVGECQVAKNRLLVPKSRKGKGKSGSTSVQVGKDVLDALRPALTDRGNDAPLLERWRHRQVSGNKWERDGRGPWQSASEFDRPWEAIRERAKMPEVIPYALRHSSIVRGLRVNLPIRLVAAMHDTSVAMIERHYAKWIVDGLEELAARAVVPLVPQGKGGKIVALPR
jgi:integrase